MLLNLPAVSKSIDDGKCKSHILKSISENLSSSNGLAILKSIAKVVTEDVSLTKSMKKKSGQSRNQIVFAVRSGLNGMLDVARGTFCEVIEEIHEEAKRIQEELALPGLELKYSVQRGFHLKVDCYNPRLPQHLPFSCFTCNLPTLFFSY